MDCPLLSRARSAPIAARIAVGVSRGFAAPVAFRWLPVVLLAVVAYAHDVQAAPAESDSVPVAADAPQAVYTLGPGQPSTWPDVSGLGIGLEQLQTGLGQFRQSVSQTSSDLVLQAMDFLGVPYRRGGSSAQTGFDCSGFVRTVYERTLGLVLPRRAAEQAQSTSKISPDELRPGDLVFFNTMRRAFSHVGIYVGDGKFIHSPRAGGKVRVEDMREAYWAKRFNGARRVNIDTTTPVNPIN